MLASSTKPLRDKEDQETPRRNRTVERGKCQTKKTQNKKKERNWRAKRKRTLR
jgi:hypothetical protein